MMLSKMFEKKLDNFRFMRQNVAMRNHSPFYCLIPGSFRPPHQGHYEMISHYQSLASEVGGKVIVLVSNPSKKNERLTGSGQVITPQFVKERLLKCLEIVLK